MKINKALPHLNCIYLFYCNNYNDKNFMIIMNSNKFVCEWWREIEKWIQRQTFFPDRKTNSCGILIGCYGNIKLEIINKKCDNPERILSLEINTDDSLWLLISIYNANNKPEKLKTLSDLKTKQCWQYSKKYIIFDSHFNIIFILFLKSMEGIKF